ncbi:hypothetical protein [Reichenbachiella ulvae]|uniref:HmuY protein n=1 Tax=Reichenbachiella ulvae TaxID=2980104 RepID=A0ABT3CSV1_9BACT|nr:hypothetical protein [Reichenbachiella ulvae]MCV9386785.1 hypothetical protein [Reichenbachiella ulvae]
MIRAVFIGKIINSTLAILLMASMMLNSCSEPDPFPETPNISFESLKFIETTQNGIPDSLILAFNFEDGDGDLGLESFENEYPYHNFEFIVDADGRAVTFSTNDITLPLYRQIPNTDLTSLFSEEDIRPSYSCEDYDTLRINDSRDTYVPQGAPSNFPGSENYHLDTIYVVKNEARNNIYVEYYWDRGNGFEELDWAYATNEFGCGESYNGRFPILDAQNMGTSLQGEIRYAMISSGFKIVFRNYPFKLKFYIYDRKLNKSNVVETPVYTLDELTTISND